MRRTSPLQRVGALAAAASAAAILANTAPADAQTRSLEIRELNAQIVVTTGGNVIVTERFVVHFSGSWNGIYRTIPVEYRTSSGLNYTLRLRPESVTDDAGTPLRYDVERDGRNRRIRMWVPDAHDATRTVILTYHVDNALRFFEEHDELYWNVTGDQWDYPVLSVTADVLLPEGIDGIRTASFAGNHGSTEAAIVEQLGNVVTFRSTRPTGYREDLTIVVGWNPGVVQRPTVAQKAGAALASNAILFAPIVAFLAMFTAWRRFGRDPEPGSVFVRYEPPADMTPAECGTLMDDRPDLRDITATIVDLAVRGYLLIEEKRRGGLRGLARGRRDYQLELLAADQWHHLKPHEQTLLRALLGHAKHNRVLMSDLENEFYTHLPKIRKQLSASLVSGGYYVRRPDMVRAAWFGAGIAAAGVIGVGGAMLAAFFGTSVAAVVVASIGTFIIVAAFGWLMPRRTTEGARMHTWLRGFEEFLGRVDRDRLERLIESPAAFEKFLPYAMAFGVEKNWARAFDGIAKEPPDWYRSSSGRPFRPNTFIADLGRMTGTAGSAMSSAPRSSSSGSSGFSGGSSGGGFGGGGGGGF